MLIAGAINFVVFIERRNDYHSGGGLRRYVRASARSTAWTAGCSPARSSRPGRTAGPGRARRSPAWTTGAGRLPAGRPRPVGRVITTDLLLALLGGAVAGGGLLLLVASLVGWAPADRPGPSLSDRSRRATRPPARPRRRRSARSCCWSPAGWWSPSPSACSASSPTALFGGAAEDRTEVAQLEALATWTESLRDTIAGAVGLEQAIPASLHAAAPVLKPPLALLIDRLRTREPLPEALLRFADDLDDPCADLIVAALVLNARLRGPGLRDVLTALAESAREELDMRGRIEAEPRVHPAQRADHHRADPARRLRRCASSTRPTSSRTTPSPARSRSAWSAPSSPPASSGCAA